MEIRLVPYLIMTGCSAAACILWFFLADRRRHTDGKSLPLSLLVLVFGILLGTACARAVWVMLLCHHLQHNLMHIDNPMHTLNLFFQLFRLYR